MVSGHTGNVASAAEIAEENDDFQNGAAPAQRFDEIPADLSAVHDAWPTLAEPIKAAIMALVGAANG